MIDDDVFKALESRNAKLILENRKLKGEIDKLREEKQLMYTDLLRMKTPLMNSLMQSMRLRKYHVKAITGMTNTMTNFGWNLPPGVSSIPGDHDMTASYEITFPFTYFNDDNEDHMQVIAECIELIDYQVNSITSNSDGSFTAIITYADDLDIDPRGMDESDIEYIIIEHLNNTYNLNIDAHSDDVWFNELNIHR